MELYLQDFLNYLPEHTERAFLLAHMNTNSPLDP